MAGDDTPTAGIGYGQARGLQRNSADDSIDREVTYETAYEAPWRDGRGACCVVRATAVSPHARRSCGDCTACCDGWLQIEVRGHAVRKGSPCPFSAAGRCTIYPDRPRHPCREFVCGWLTASSPLPDWMRPDRSQLILLAANFVWRGLAVDVAVAVGEHPKTKALDWMKRFSAETRRPLIYQVDDEWFACGPPAFQSEIAARMGRGDKPWDNS
jgi:hypothetical protein